MTVSPPLVGPLACGDRTQLSVLGTVVTVDAARASWSARLRTVLAPFVVDGSEAAPPPALALSVLDRPDGRTGRDDDRAVLVQGATELAVGRWASIEARILVEVNAAAIRGYRGLAVHAGVVAVGDRAICFPGPSGLGKSTMTAACLAAGFDYVSDEALCIDRDTRAVVPYPRPIALAPSSVALLGLEGAPLGGSHPVIDGEGRDVVLTADSLGARSVEPHRRLRLTDVVELHRGAAGVHLEALPRAQVVRSLLTMSFNHFEEPATSVEVVTTLARSTRVWRLHHDDPTVAAEQLARHLG